MIYKPLPGVPRYQLDIENGKMLVTFPTEKDMWLFIQTQLAEELEYETRILH